MIFWMRKRPTGQMAKERLKVLLISDRVRCSKETMELMKMDIAKVISKYMKIDTEHMDIQIQTKAGITQADCRNPILYANVPIIDIRN